MAISFRRAMTLSSRATYGKPFMSHHGRQNHYSHEYDAASEPFMAPYGGESSVWL
jgi:hypothetical protein